MSANKKFHLISDLKPFKDVWRVQVKLIHSWIQNPPYADETLEMVLADQTGAKVQCSCKRTLIKRVQRNLTLGKWRVIQNMKISGTGGKYKPTNLAYKMSITNDTVFADSDLTDDSSFLSLASYEEILNGSADTKCLIDIIGQAIDIGEVQIIQVHNEDRKRVLFRIRDNSGNALACCLWGRYAEQIEHHLENHVGEDIVCVIRFAKISEFGGEVQITNAFDASLLDLNPTMAEALDFKEKLKNQVLALAGNDNQRDPKKELIKVADDWDDVGIIPISELHETSELENVKIVCSVEAVDTDWAWYYFGCKSCGKIVTRIRRSVSGKLAKPLFRCPGCRTNGSNVLPKFKLHLIVRDDTGDCKLVLLGSIAKTLIGLEAHEIWDGSYEEIEDPENLPQPILDLVDKSFCFGLCPSDSGSEIYKVSKVWSGDIIHQIETESEPVTLIEGCSSTVSSGGVMLQDVDTHASSEDCATPFSKRKETDSELPDITSTSKKLCTPTIKTEKSKID
ncbi:replication protein A 70 kDa DNA-binding subunit A-like [Brassica napus]|uniref:replication protein A 70 kDa DNA-binding subunit A-like n=1 Tax=Brassica napus TaxID=3708 RepID=UPI000BBE31C6|nr:replication protein A 70 kDa DNA-binding subunit A-like [Brassica napus]